MPGSIVFRPLQATFNLDTNPLARIRPYCKFKLGRHTAKTNAAHCKETVDAEWDDTVVLERKHNEPFAKLKVKDKSPFGVNKVIGKAKIDLDVIIAKRTFTQSYSIYHKGGHVGEVLLAAEYEYKSSYSVME